MKLPSFVLFIASLALATALWIGYAIIVSCVVGGVDNAGLFGDMFGGFTAFVSALGFAAVVTTLHMQMRQAAEVRSEEVHKRNLELQRAVFLDVAGMIGQQTERIVPFAFPTGNYVAPEGAAGALNRFLLVAEPHSVDMLLNLNVSFAVNLGTAVAEKKKALDLDAAIKNQQLRVEAEIKTLSQLKGESAREDKIRSHEAKIYSEDIVLRALKADALKQWAVFHGSVEALLDAFTEGQRTIIVALREELGVRTDSDKMISLMKERALKAKVAALAAFDIFRVNHVESL